MCSDYIRHKYQILLQFVTELTIFLTESRNMLNKSTKLLRSLMLAIVIGGAFMAGNLTSWLALCPQKQLPKRALVQEAWRVDSNYFVDQDKSILGQ
jgi:hypothetical protein